MTKQDIFDLLQDIPAEAFDVFNVVMPSVIVPNVTDDVNTNIKAIATQARNEALILQAYAGKKIGLLTAFSGYRKPVDLANFTMNSRGTVLTSGGTAEWPKPANAPEMLAVLGVEWGSLQSLYVKDTTGNETTDGHNMGVIERILTSVSSWFPAITGAGLAIKAMLFLGLYMTRSKLVFKTDTPAQIYTEDYTESDGLIWLGKLFLEKALDLLVDYLTQTDIDFPTQPDNRESLDAIKDAIQQSKDVLKSGLIGKDKFGEDKPLLKEISDSILDLLLQEGIIEIDGIRVWMKAKMVDAGSSDAGV